MEVDKFRYLRGWASYGADDWSSGGSRFVNFWEHVESGGFWIGGFECLRCSFWYQFLFSESVDGAVDFVHVFLSEVLRLLLVKIGVTQLSFCFCNVGPNVLDDNGAPFICIADQDVVSFLQICQGNLLPLAEILPVSSVRGGDVVLDLVFHCLNIGLHRMVYRLWHPGGVGAVGKALIIVIFFVFKVCSKSKPSKIFFSFVVKDFLVVFSRIGNKV